MKHYVALLRGINLGRRRLKMDRLRELFVELRFANVSTFIASGNVLFSSNSGDDARLAKQIAAHLEKSLGYEVDTFVRTRAEIAAAAAFQAFAADDHAHPANTIYAAFLHEALAPPQRRALLACRTAIDEFGVNERELYWLCRTKSNDSKVWSSPAMKAVGLASLTMRNLTTVRKLAALFPA